jgi:hypothetical protein
MTDTDAPGHAGGDALDIFGPLERSGALRGWVLVAIVVVVGALVLPSATRPGLGTAPAAASSATVPVSTNPGSAPTLPPTSSSTTSSSTTTAPITIAPSTIKVLVANGTNTNGAASAVASFLSGKGFSTLTPVNALTVVKASQVYAVGGATAAAREVTDALGLPETSVQPASQPVPVASVGAATVVVVVGPDLGSRA